jgi:hypothetical protein
MTLTNRSETYRRRCIESDAPVEPLTTRIVELVALLRGCNAIQNRVSTLMRWMSSGKGDIRNLASRSFDMPPLRRLEVDRAALHWFIELASIIPLRILMMRHAAFA